MVFADGSKEEEGDGDGDGGKGEIVRISSCL